MIRQNDFQSFNTKNGVQVLMDNGDICVIKEDDDRRYGLYCGDRMYGITTKSKHVMACLVYVYPEEDL